MDRPVFSSYVWVCSLDWRSAKLITLYSAAREHSPLR